MSNITAAFMATGLTAPRPCLTLDQILQHTSQSRGHIEVVHEMLRYVDYADALFVAASKIAEVPGVWAYEVAEEFGAWFGQRLVETPPGDGVDPDMCRVQLRYLTLDFFTLGGRERKHFDALFGALQDVGKE